MESDRYENEEMVAKGCRAGSKTIEREHRKNGSANSRVKVMHANTDGLMSSITEIKDHLNEKKPEAACRTETKLKSEINVGFEAEYNTWRRDRNNKGGGGGVMILVKKDILVEKVEYGGGRSETMSVEIRIQGQENRKIIVAYMPPKTSTWGADEYKHMQSELIKSIDDMLKMRSKVLLVGDFNNKEINWGEMEV